MTPYDVKRELKALYAPKNTAWALVDVPEQAFLAVDGAGDPNTAPAYARAVEALYAVAYTLKFAGKRDGRDFVVGPLEGLWWAADASVFTARAKDSWQWTMLVVLPDWITPEAVEDAKRAATAKKGLPGIADLRRLVLHEGPAAQALHIGSYDDEGPLLAQLHDEWLAEHDLTFGGAHHEVYLSDPRRTAPAKRRTVLRQPVRPIPRVVSATGAAAPPPPPA
ncbi:GyrI-like domain-containing protein [Saccharothrix obliqua]|uniref:GyrI-like domain-containing protein n=1 Tax=Saccharothrix obliqua TaxID=2861747 RepID=UPI001C60349C|nr:GyrI-like domain-containing protein [Saccharothrix obliqua]MBW4718213.1 GyrI-like domain-containing protein [Saccharothrix obliqua]